MPFGSLRFGLGFTGGQGGVTPEAELIAITWYAVDITWHGTAITWW